MTRFPDIDTFAGRHQIGRPTRPAQRHLTNVFVACLSDAANVSAAADHIRIHIAHE
jgi:hypothetical protein